MSPSRALVEVTRIIAPFGRVVVRRGTSTDLVAQLDIERGEDGRRGPNRFVAIAPGNRDDGGAR